MTFAWSVLALFILAGIAVCLFGSFEITRIPFLAVPYTPRDMGWPSEEIAFESFDGLRLTGWFVPAPRPSPVTIVILHGVGSNAGDMILNTLCLYGGPWNLFYFNFRGHGGSEGRWTSLGPLELKDLEKALDFLKTHKPEASRRLGIYGHSLGAAVAIVGAARRPELAAVAAESSFASAARTIRRFSWVFYGIPYFPFVPIALAAASLRLGCRIGGFAPVQEIGRIAPRPLFLIQAERDARMPLSDAQEIFEAAGEPKQLWIAPGADHGEPWMVDKEDYDRRLRGFFDDVFAS